MSEAAERIRPRSALARCLLPAALFTALMAAFFLGVDPYLDDGAELIPGGELEAVDGGAPVGEGTPWRVFAARTTWEPREGFAGSGGVRLDAAGGRGGMLEYVIEEPTRFSHLRARGLMRGEEIAVGRRPWNSARILLFFRDAQGKPHWNHPHNVCYEAGTYDWQRCDEVIEVPSWAASGHLYVQNSGRSGRMWVDELSVVPVRPRAAFEIWRWAFAAGWVATALSCIWLLRLWRRPFGLAITAVAAVIAAGLTLPGAFVEEAAREQIILIDNLRATANGASIAAGLEATSADATQRADAQAPGSRASAGGAAKKAEPTAGTQQSGKTDGGRSKASAEQPRARVSPDRLREYLEWIKSGSHQWLFALLAAFTAASLGRGLLREPRPLPEALAAISLAIAGLLLYAAATEVLQFTSLSRGPSVQDWVIDSGGIALGLLVGALPWPLVAWRSARRRRATKTEA